MAAFEQFPHDSEVIRFEVTVRFSYRGRKIPAKKTLKNLQVYDLK